MKIFRTLEEAEADGPERSVVTLGVFDGVHVGHRYVLRETQRLAAEREAEAVVVTFVHHPRAVIAGKAPKLITSIEHRLRLFEDLGLDAVLALTFDDDLRRWPAADFAHRVFEEVLRAEVVVLGHNCRFGRDREGGADFLKASADRYAFEVRHAPELRLGNDIVSSTNIRAAILEGDLERAASMLGRPFSIFGTVVAGDGRGRAIGYPTANLDVHHELRPPRGVWGALVRLDDDREEHALVNIGVRPTFAGVAGTSWEDRDRVETVEVHVLDLAEDLYGRDVEVVFLTRLRGERRFAGADELRTAIAEDERRFRAFLEHGQGQKRR